MVFAGPQESFKWLICPEAIPKPLSMRRRAQVKSHGALKHWLDGMATLLLINDGLKNETLHIDGERVRFRAIQKR